MKRIDLANLVAASPQILLFAEKMIERTRSLGGQALTAIPSDRITGGFIQSLAHFSDTAKWLELPAAAAACARCHGLIQHWKFGDRIMVTRDQGQQIAAQCHQIISSFGAEVQRHHTYVVAPDEAKLLDQGIVEFGLEIVTFFPHARQDIVDGSNCRVFGLWTACVMHMMRVLEIGVGALADHLAVKRGTTWGGTIANINDALKDAARMKGDPQLRRWASETGTYLAFVKDAFRNPAMHPERTFSANEAKMIFDNARSFMAMLTDRLRTES